MQTTPETAALLQELYERSSIATELDGPQLEAWVSGLFPVFDEQASAVAFVDYCASTSSERGALLIAAIAELTTGLDQPVADHAAQRQDASLLPAWAATVGGSELTGAWSVTAPFGQSLVLGFDHSTVTAQSPDSVLKEPPSALDDQEDDESLDLRHSILVELDSQGMLMDLQLTGPSKSLLAEAAASDDRVVVTEIPVAEAVAAVIAAWPDADRDNPSYGPGFVANQQFVRRRLMVASGDALSYLHDVEAPVDVRRGLTDAEFADANRAALSTLQGAIGLPDQAALPGEGAALVTAWVAIIRGDVADVSSREREALLWLEWADWLGAGIGLYRAGLQAVATGESLVEFVNRCPEVSSSIDKADREYAEWAFDLALDLLQDHGAVAEGGQLTEAGHAAVRHALVAAWS